MASITLKSLVKVYGQTEVLHHVEGQINDGELVVIVGPSGCGKSTLLRMVAGLETVTSGQISIADKVVNDIEPADRDIAMVFQNYALYPHMTVRQNMAYGLKIRKVSKPEIDRRVQEAAEILEIGDYLERKPRQLSGGQRQRVAMGRAIVREPDLFLFDEPLSNLDAKLRNQMRIEIRALQRRLGTTSVYVTHDQVEAMTMADRIIVLNGGRIEQMGTPAEIYNTPASTFVASFMGAPPMNILSGSVSNGAVALADGTTLPERAPEGANGAVQVGLRPEDVLLGQGGVPFTIDIIEELGAHRLLHGKLGGEEFSVAINKDESAELGATTIGVKPGAVHFFDANEGKRL